MKLLKLTYIAHGYYLGFFDRPLFSNDIQAWKYGPVIPELYHVIKQFGNGSVEPFVVELYSENEIKGDDLRFIQIIWDNYKKFSSTQLSALTHKDNSPWDQVFNTRHGQVISNDIIKDYYKNWINERRRQQEAEPA